MKSVFKLALSTMVLSCTLMPAMAFPDVDSTHWAAKQIEELTEKGVIVGYPDGSFKPDADVTRAEFATMAIKALGQEHANVVQKIEFKDISEDHWAYDSIEKAVYFDLISNDDKNQNFRPDDSVSRAESITVAVNALTTETISPYKAKEIFDYDLAPYNIATRITYWNPVLEERKLCRGCSCTGTDTLPLYCAWLIDIDSLSSAMEKLVSSR